MIAGQTNLLADCSSCFGLCCVALPFSKSSDFATNKNAGDPCKNLQEDFGCGIHTGLRKKGFTRLHRLRLFRCGTEGFTADLRRHQLA